MIYKIRKIWSPEIYQGHGKTHSYFEGWYYKLIDKYGKNVHAIIPGIFISNDENLSHCFVQILDGQTGESTYHQYPIDQFWASKKILQLEIGPNTFKKDYVKLNIDSAERKISGHIKMSELTPWPVRFSSPGIMGWYAFVPFMECYHGVVSLDHQLEGLLNINGKSIDFRDGRGYTEKDWGKSFPSSYIWVQSNNFEEPGISFTASIANIPWLRGFFRGFIIGFLHNGALHRFTTYTKATVKDVRITDTQVSFMVFDKNYSLKVKAERGTGGLIHAPLRGRRPLEFEMQKRVLQSLTGKISIEFKERGKQIYSGVGHHAGVEINGNLNEIID